MLLVVDDDPDFRQLLIRVLGHGNPGRIDQASSAEQARGLLLQRPYDLVISDLSMPGEGGLGLMQWSQEQCPGPAWIVLTGHGTMDAAVKALQLGAFDFLEKPLRGVEPLRNSVRNALAHQQLTAERERLHTALEERNQQLREHVTELERAVRLVRTQAEDIRADLHRAGIIQRALLPQSAPRLGRFHVQALYRPSHAVGGDLYDVVQIDERHSVLLIADAAGHGLSAALLAVLFRSQLALVAPDSREPLSPRLALGAANRALCEGFPARGLFLTAAYCLLDTESGRALVASAGHPPLLLIRQNGDTERIFHTGPALGLHPEADYAQQQVLLEPGDRLLFYSDGLYGCLPGAADSTGEEIAAAFRGERPEALERLIGSSGAFRSADDEAPEDDVTLLLLSAAPGPSRLDNGAPQSWPGPAEPARRSAPDILVGSDSRGTALCIQGRANWTRSAAFHAECVAALEGGRPVVIDLTLCQHLDSTFLGILHELSERADDSDWELRLQGVSTRLEGLFEELGMERVLERVLPRMLPLPTRMQVVAREVDSKSQGTLTLRVHESLAALGDRNRQEFDPLLELLRAEVSGPSQ